MEKDYSLLRPFDLEAAKRGEAIDDTFGGRVVLVDGPDAGGRYAVRVDGHFAVVLGSNLRMAPLCWIEGRPLYRDHEPLFERGTGKQFRAINVGEREEAIVGFIREGPQVELGCHRKPDVLTWTPPKVKREGWIAVSSTKPRSLLVAYVSHVYDSQEKAESEHPHHTIVHIEWEEPV